MAAARQDRPMATVRSRLQRQSAAEIEQRRAMRPSRQSLVSASSIVGLSVCAHPSTLSPPGLDREKGACPDRLPTRNNGATAVSINLCHCHPNGRRASKRTIAFDDDENEDDIAS
ncbi:hypothetical protein MGYG_03854 [Nannizzia gypsea CBS 118893]|uniref:Uncharacterized protein n=1 Tax=Arthroderma gypseum (strain ATCC MYA-4604 / CBS 118893) TaxID=535722 RepID=E4UU81_ARTGP|nr:hypothetical protein MGYG_03854 [Nannizzia gypsea CBS 118893]EFR00848.1 hypothetical protein MGYG_03854 [Nannizzia gypsea CBS 118893]